MCGLIAGFNKKPKYKGKESHKTKRKALPVNEKLIELYDKQEQRGTKGFGFININTNNQIDIKRSVNATKFLFDIARFETTMAILHHRNPTSTANLIKQTHPIVVENELLKKKYLLVHNGVIRNDKILKKKHEALGFKYTTEYEESYGQHSYKWEKFNDSESLAIEVALFIEGLEKKIGTDGGAAFIVLQTDTNNIAEKIYFGRHNNPLVMEKTENSLFLSSEGEEDLITEDVLYSFDIKDPEMNLEEKIMEFEEYKEPVKELPKPEKPEDIETTKPANEDKIQLAERFKEFEEKIKKLTVYAEVQQAQDDEVTTINELLVDKIDESQDIILSMMKPDDSETREAKQKAAAFTFLTLSTIEKIRKATDERIEQMIEEDTSGHGPSDEPEEEPIIETEVISEDPEDDKNPLKGIIKQETNHIGYDVKRNLPVKQKIRPDITEAEWEQQRNKYSKRD